MSEYCDSCDEHLDWIEGDLDDPDNCVKCQLKAAKIEVLKEVLEEGNKVGFEYVREFVEAKINELESPPGATELGFKIGKVYEPIGPDKRVSFHILDERHYAGVWRDGLRPPAIHEIENIDKRHEYKEKS